MTSKTIANGILRAVGILAARVLLGYFLYKIQSVLAYLCIASVFALIGRPIVLFLRKRLKFPNTLAVVITISLIIGVFAGIIALFIPLLTEQGKNLSLLDIDKLQTTIDWFKTSSHDSAITVARERNFFWSDGLRPVNFKENDRLSTTSGPSLFKATHSLVFYKKEYMLKNWELFSNTHNDPYPYQIDWPEDELVDVDTELDFKLVKALSSGVH